MERYDSDIQPDAGAWLALSEDERLILVQDYHTRLREKLPNARMHASMHVVVESE